MRFVPLALHGAHRIEIEPAEDPRGYFARTWCRREFEARGLQTSIAQCSISSNRQAGTLRGMHVQGAPHAEAKVVTCLQGAAYDVLLDLRPDSATFGRFISEKLESSRHAMLYVPEGVAHGFQTLEPDTVIAYQISEFFHPELALGVRYNDPRFGIDWPLPVSMISERDRTFPDFY